MAARDREEQSPTKQGPYKQSRQIAELPERRRKEKDAGRIRPVLPRIVRAEQRRECTVIFRNVVETARIGRRRGAPAHPEIQEVAPDHEAGAVTRNFAP